VLACCEAYSSRRYPSPPCCCVTTVRTSHSIKLNTTNPSPHHHIPLEKPLALGSPILDSHKTIPSHCYNITFPPNTNNHLILPIPISSPPTMPIPDICCMNPHRSLSPTEPARPSALALDGIFAVAALPEDHPHSLNLNLKFADRFRGSPKSLIRSPSFANKLKGQLRRRATVKCLKAEFYDEDARQMTSKEVVARVGLASLRLRAGDDEVPTLRLRKS
jgi:hypothetical protein